MKPWLPAAATMKPFTGRRERRGLLGDKDADVLFLTLTTLLNSDGSLLDASVIKDGMDSVEQYPQWTPHLTLGYPDSPATLAEEPEAITIDRLALAGRGTNAPPYPWEQTWLTTTCEPTPLMTLIDVVESVPFWESLCPEGTPSGDRRQFGAGALRSCPLPLPLSYQRVNMDGHDGSVRVGTIERAWRKGSARVRALDACSPPSLKSTKSSASWLNRAAGLACPSTPTTSKSR